MENVPNRQINYERTFFGSTTLGGILTLSSDDLESGFEVKSLIVSALNTGESKPTTERFVLLIGGVPYYNAIMKADTGGIGIYQFTRNFPVPIFANGRLIDPGITAQVGSGGETGNYYVQLSGSVVPNESVVAVPNSG